jgi:hypothetical protein
MVEIDKDAQALTDEIVRFATLDVGDEADTARIMFVARIVKALSGRKIAHVSPLPAGSRRSSRYGCAAK